MSHGRYFYSLVITKLFQAFILNITTTIRSLYLFKTLCNIAMVENITIAVLYIKLTLRFFLFKHGSLRNKKQQVHFTFSSLRVYTRFINKQNLPQCIIFNVLPHKVFLNTPLYLTGRFFNFDHA